MDIAFVADSGREYGPFQFNLPAGSPATMASLLDSGLASSGVDPGTFNVAVTSEQEARILLRGLHAIKVLSAPIGTKVNWSSGGTDPFTMGEELASGVTLGPFESASAGSIVPKHILGGGQLQAITVRLTGAPTGGVFGFTLAPLGSTTQFSVTGIPYNASADTLLQAVIAASSGHFNTRNIGATNGPATTYITLLPLGDRFGQQYQCVAVDGAGLTGGTSPGVSVSFGTHQEFRDDQVVGVMDGNVLYSAAAQPSSGAATLVAGGPTGNIAQLATTGPTNSSAWVQNLAETVNSESRVVEYTFHNPHATPITFGLEHYLNTNANQLRPVIIPPGWSKALMHEGQRTGNLPVMGDLTQINRVRVRVGQYNTEQLHYASDGVVRLNVGHIARARARIPRIVLLFDDGRQDLYTTIYPILQEFPTLKGKLGVGVISGRLNTPGYCTTGQLQEMKNSGWIYCVNHSDTHGGPSSRSFETSLNPARVGQSTGTDFCVEWKAGAIPSSGSVTLTFQGGATAAFAFNDSLKNITGAILAAVPGAIVTCEDTVNSTFGLGNGLRVTLPTAQTLPTISNTTNYDIGWSYTVDDIITDFQNCRSFLIANGLSSQGSESIAVYPVGSYGRAVHAAMLQGNYSIGFGAGPISSIDWTDFSSIAKLNPFRIPRRDVVSEASSGRRVLSSLLSSLEYGGVLTLMGHTVVAGATAGVNLSPDDFRRLLTIVSQLEGTYAKVVTAMEVRDCAKAQFGELTRRAHGALQ
jgi:hypothetical protein